VHEFEGPGDAAFPARSAPGGETGRHGSAGSGREVAAYCARLGDAEIATLLTLVVLPAVEGSAVAATLVGSAAARLARADAGAIPERAAGALAAAFAAVASRTPTPLPAALTPGRGLRVWRPPSR
jgi:hypothetical protein